MTLYMMGRVGRFGWRVTCCIGGVLIFTGSGSDLIYPFELVALDPDLATL